MRLFDVYQGRSINSLYNTFAAQVLVDFGPVALIPPEKDTGCGRLVSKLSTQGGHQTNRTTMAARKTVSSTTTHLLQAGMMASVIKDIVSYVKRHIHN